MPVIEEHVNKAITALEAKIKAYRALRDKLNAGNLTTNEQKVMRETLSKISDDIGVIIKQANEIQRQFEIDKSKGGTLLPSLVRAVGRLEVIKNDWEVEYLNDTFENTKVSKLWDPAAQYIARIELKAGLTPDKGLQNVSAAFRGRINFHREQMKDKIKVERITRAEDELLKALRKQGEDDKSNVEAATRGIVALIATAAAKDTGNAMAAPFIAAARKMSAMFTRGEPGSPSSEESDSTPGTPGSPEIASKIADKARAVQRKKDLGNPEQPGEYNRNLYRGRTTSEEDLKRMGPPPPVPPQSSKPTKPGVPQRPQGPVKPKPGGG